MERVHVITVTTLFNDRSESTHIETLRLTREDCLNLVRFKMCNGDHMVCEGSAGCTYDGTPQAEYVWPRTIPKTGYKCQFYPRIINAEQVSDFIFQTPGHNCYPRDLECKLHDSVVIWEPDVIHSCPFELLWIADFEVIHENLYVTNTSKLLFQVTGYIQECGQTLLTTSKGMFLGPTEANITKGKPSFKSVGNLMLADEDLKNLQLTRMYRSVSRSLCYLSTWTLSLLAHFHDRYLTIQDVRGNDMVIYTYHGSLYVPQCYLVSQIEISDALLNCYVDTPVRFTYRNKTMSAFLNSQGILRPTSRLELCANSIQKIPLPRTKRVIVRNGTSVSLKPNKGTVSLELFHQNFTKLNYHQIRFVMINFTHVFLIMQVQIVILQILTTIV